jgi:hypothetical protein
MAARPPEIECPAAAKNMDVWEALGGGNSGIKGNKLHVYGFHRGAAYVDPHDYSRQRDPNGWDGPFPHWGWCCAGDYRHGGNKVLRARHAVLLTRLMDGDPSLSNVCEFIGQPWADKPVYYWALWNGRRTLQRYTGAGHDMWSHVSTYRSRSGTVPSLWTPPTAVKPVVRPPQTPPKKPAVPVWPKGLSSMLPGGKVEYHAVVRQWQARMRQRGWKITVDGWYGRQSEQVAAVFQREKRLRVSVPGALGPVTFAAAWTAKIT